MPTGTPAAHHGPHRPESEGKTTLHIGGAPIPPGGTRDIEESAIPGRDPADGDYNAEHWEKFLVRGVSDIKPDKVV